MNPYESFSHKEGKLTRWKKTKPLARAMAKRQQLLEEHSTRLNPRGGVYCARPRGDTGLELSKSDRLSTLAVSVAQCWVLETKDETASSLEVFAGLPIRAHQLTVHFQVVWFGLRWAWNMVGLYELVCSNRCSLSWKPWAAVGELIFSGIRGEGPFKKLWV